MKFCILLVRNFSATANAADPAISTPAPAKGRHLGLDIDTSPIFDVCETAAELGISSFRSEADR